MKYMMVNILSNDAHYTLGFPENTTAFDIARAYARRTEQNLHSFALQYKGRPVTVGTVFKIPRNQEKADFELEAVDLIGVENQRDIEMQIGEGMEQIVEDEEEDENGDEEEAEMGKENVSEDDEEHQEGEVNENEEMMDESGAFVGHDNCKEELVLNEFGMEDESEY